MGAEEKPYEWAAKVCMASEETDPAALLEKLFAQPECVPFGPVHHFLVGGSLLTARCNADGADRETVLAPQLEEMQKRSVIVPGGACGDWGACGAAISVGMAYSIIHQNSSVKAEGWDDAQKLVAQCLNAIAEAGSPRCCKRDSRVVIRLAAPVFGLVTADKDPTCAVFGKNTVCLHEACPYFPKKSA